MEPAVMMERTKFSRCDSLVLTRERLGTQRKAQMVPPSPIRPSFLRCDSIQLNRERLMRRKQNKSMRTYSQMLPPPARGVCVDPFVDES